MFVLFYFKANSNDLLLAEIIPAKTVPEAVDYVNRRDNPNLVPFRLVRQGETEESLFTWQLGYYRVEAEKNWWQRLAAKA